MWCIRNFRDITWVSDMYKTNSKHQIEMYVLNVSIRNYCFDDNMEIIVANTPFLLKRWESSTSGHSWYVCVSSSSKCIFITFCMEEDIPCLWEF